ncbi:MAG: zinc ribbon domain-containing protein [Chitinophagaceae bacterium]
MPAAPPPPPPLSSPPQPPALVMCPKCHQLSPGNFCSHCGTSLKEDAESIKDPFLSFATSFLNIDNFRHYLKIFFTIFPRPAANTIKLHKVIAFESAMKFMEYSVALYTLLSASKIVFITLGNRISEQALWKDVLVEIMYLLYAVGCYLITLKLFYYFASRKYGKKDKREYIKMYCLFAGFLLPIMGIIYYAVGDFISPQALHGSAGFLVVKFALSMALGISSLVYGFFCWKYFWNAPDQKVVALLLWAGLISFVSGFILLVIIFWSLNLDF